MKKSINTNYFINNIIIIRRNTRSWSPKQIQIIMYYIMLTFFVYFHWFRFEQIFQNDVEQIIKCLTGETRLRYSKAVRRFAFTIDYYSPKVYRYIRETFNRNLPHPSTLKKYYVNSGANGEPGISTESIESLRLIVNDFQMTGENHFIDKIFGNRCCHSQYNLWWPNNKPGNVQVSWCLI